VIVLVGFMGAGKTTVGHLLAERLGLPFTDSDQVIEQRAGRPVRQIFAEDGEPAFRALEHQVIASLLDGPDLVLALGGGAGGIGGFGGGGGGTASSVNSWVEQNCTEVPASAYGGSAASSTTGGGTGGLYRCG